MKKIIATFLCIVMVVLSVPMIAVITDAAFNRSTDVIWNYSESVTAKKIRYIAQTPGSGSPSQYFNSNYWKDGNGKQGCFVASTSMVLSYLGINVTPKKMFELGMATNNSSTSFNDMYNSSTVATKASNYSGISISSVYTGSSITSLSTMDSAINNFINNGEYYSPVIVYQSGLWSGHYYVVTRKISGSTYEIIDPVVETYTTRDITYVSDIVQYKRSSPITTTYTVSYNANGGSGAPAAQTKSSSSNLTLSSTKPTREGYTFLGWATSSTATSASYAAGGTYSTNANVTLYAVWKINTYTVSYNANGGSGAPGNQTKTHGTNLALSTTTPTRSGYAFQGWATSASATSANYQPGATYSNNANVTLYAVWKGCTVWSDWSTTKPSSGEYETATQYRYRDKDIKKNGSSSVTGYTQSAKTKIGSTSYSAWTAIKPTVSNSSDSSYSYERSLETKTAYLYTAWYNSSSYNYFWYNHSGVNSPRYMSVYTDKSVSSTLADDGHNYLKSTGSTKLTTGTTDSVIGYIYVMYDYDDSGSGYPQNGKTISSFTSKSSSLPLYIGDTTPAFSGTTAPVYRIATDTYQYTHYKWGDWSSWSTNAVSANDNRQVETRTVYRYKVATQHTFGGWTKTKDATCTATGTQTRTCSVCGTVETGSIAALGHSYGSWVNDTAAGVRRRTCSRCSNVETETYFYNVSYNANGGSGAPATQIKTKNTNLTLSSTTPTRAGYAFQGWATSASATSVAYQPGGSYNSNAAVTLYAVWKAYVINVYYNTGGGTIGNSTYGSTADSNGLLSCYDTAEYGKTFGEYGLTNVNSDVFDLSKTGHHLSAGEEWKAENGALLSQSDNSYTAQQVASICGKDLTKGDVSVTLYANWIADTYTITFDANGGSNAPASQTKTYGKDLTLSSSVPVKDKYTFVGWATSNTATTATYAPGAVFKTNANTTLYAVWELTHVHSYTSSVTTKATCTTDGIKTFTCLCGDSYTETIKATGHKNTVRITEKKPTCLEKGSEDEYCLDCSELVGTYEIPALGHDFVLTEKNKNHPHNEKYKCSRCGEIKTTDSIYSETCPECNFTSTATDNNSCKITGYTGNLEKITIPATLNGKKVTSTNTGALKANSVITEVTIEDGVSEIGSLTFMNCTNLEKVIVPESVTTIGSMPFYGCADGFKVYCYRGSFAQEYCETNNIDYVILDIAAQKATEIDYENKLIFTQKEACFDILDLLKIPSTSIAVPMASYTSAGNEYLGTGSTVTVFENKNYIGDYKVIVEGDLDGDSVCDVLDITMAERVANKNATATKEQIYAANGCVSEEIDVMSYQNVVNSALS